MTKADRRHLLVLFLITQIMIIGCTSRTKEIVKEQYVISDIIASRIDDSSKKQPTKEELEGFVVGTRDTFETLKNKGKSISVAVYSKAVVLANKIQNKEQVDMEELRQFTKMTRDAYKLLLEADK